MNNFYFQFYFNIKLNSNKINTLNNKRFKFIIDASYIYKMAYKNE